MFSCYGTLFFLYIFTGISENMESMKIGNPLSKPLTSKCPPGRGILSKYAEVDVEQRLFNIYLRLNKFHRNQNSLV